MKKMYKNKRESSNSFSNLELSSSIDLAWSESDMDDSVTKSNLLLTVRSCYKLCKLMEYDSDEFILKIRKRIDEEVVPMYEEKMRKKEIEKRKRGKRNRSMIGDYSDPNGGKHMEALKRQNKDDYYTRSHQDEVTDIESENSEAMEVESGQTSVIESTQTNTSTTTTEGRKLRNEIVKNNIRKSNRLKNKFKKSY